MDMDMDITKPLGMYAYTTFTKKQALAFMWKFLTCSLLTKPELSFAGRVETILRYTTPLGKTYPVSGFSPYGLLSSDFRSEQEFIESTLPLFRKKIPFAAICVGGTNAQDMRRATLTTGYIDTEKDVVFFLLNLPDAMRGYADPEKWHFTANERAIISYFDDAAKKLSEGRAERYLA